MDRNRIGTDAEKAAETFLRKQHLKLLERNFHCRFGEIDLIMFEQDTLVFIEVRKRRDQRFGGAAMSVDYRKQQKIITTAQFFLSQHPKHADKNCRFDVIAFESDAAPSAPLWYKDAFRI